MVLGDAIQSLGHSYHTCSPSTLRLYVTRLEQRRVVRTLERLHTNCHATIKAKLASLLVVATYRLN